MICQRCGIVEATVHFSGPGNTDGRFQWLCAKCADMIVSALVEKSADGAQKSEEPAPDSPDSDQFHGSAIDEQQRGEWLGKMFGLSTGPVDTDDKSCSQCGLNLAHFRQTGLLGCPRCYVDFREVLRPFLGRLHGQTSHLGRNPGEAGGMTSPQVQAMRLRVDLEKAIALENFEQAAVIRDELRALTDSSPGPE